MGEFYVMCCETRRYRIGTTHYVNGVFVSKAAHDAALAIMAWCDPVTGNPRMTTWDELRAGKARNSEATGDAAGSQ